MVGSRPRPHRKPPATSGVGGTSTSTSTSAAANATAANANAANAPPTPRRARWSWRYRYVMVSAVCLPCFLWVTTSGYFIDKNGNHLDGGYYVAFFFFAMMFVFGTPLMDEEWEPAQKTVKKE